MSDQACRLPDGRNLAFRVAGGAADPVVMFMPGFMASRLTGRPASGARIVTADRPGIGRSDPRRHRTLLDWADDVAALADHLEVDRFAVLGHSARAPYAAAVAHRLPDRVCSLGIACGFAPLNRPGATTGVHPQMARGLDGLQKAPWMSRLATAGLPRQYRKDPAAAFHKQFGRLLGPSDTAAIAAPAECQGLLDAAVESARQGSKALSVEMRLALCDPWGFEPNELRVPTQLWYGADDPMTPPQMGEYLASAIPDAELTGYPDEGHMTAFTHWTEIVGTLLALSPKTRH